MTPLRPGCFQIPSVYIALTVAARRTGAKEPPRFSSLLRPLAWRRQQ